MLNPWFSTMMLVAESCQVIGLRMIKMSFGGQGALDEVRLMVREKVGASWEAGTALLDGGNAFGMVDRYREHVAANARRLAPELARRADRSDALSDDEVRMRAYELWSSAGRRHGHDLEDWLQATALITATRVSS